MLALGYDNLGQRPYRSQQYPFYLVVTNSKDDE